MSGGGTRWRKLSALLDGALELPESERDLFLDRECAGDAALRAEAEAVLASAMRDGLLSRPVVDVASPLLTGTGWGGAAAPAGARKGDRIGPYRVISELGRGGMGTVYLAERADGAFEQTVALKLVKRGMDSEEILRRFVAERRILARLEHDAIARLYDGGVAADGTPWFAMERVEGEPIVSYAEGRALPAAARVALLLQVCEAVQFAHRNLVVHRDLKPANVLVTAEGRVKLLDFGIAKLLDDESTGATRTELRLMTPEYAAPEQLTGEAVTTSTDVWALGLLAHEVLTGRRPERRVIEPPPSRALGSPTIARELPRDMRQILARALAAEPERRYRSAEAFADDLRAFLAGRPVAARGDSFGYRAGKFVRRNRLGVAAAATALVALASGLAVSLWQARVARREAARARTVKEFLISTFGEARPEIAKGEETTAREILERGLGRIDRDLASDPALQAEMLETVAAIEGELGAHPKALGLWRRALALRERDAAGGGDAVHRARLGLAGAALEAGELEAAESEAARAYAVSAGAHGAESVEAFEALGVLGSSHRKLGRIEAAESELATALAGLRRRLPADDPRITRALDGLANATFDAGKLREAEPLFRELVARAERLGGADSLEMADALDDLGVVTDELDQNEEAERIFSRSLAMREKLLGPEHPAVAASLKNLGSFYQASGRFDESTTALLRAIAISERALGATSYGAADATNTLAVVDYQRGDFESAERRMSRVLAIWRETLGEEHPNTLTVAANRAAILAELGRLEEAEAACAQVLAVRRRMGREDDNLTAALNVYGDVLSQRGRIEPALAAWEEALVINRRVFGAESPVIATGLWYEGRALRERGTPADLARAEELLGRGLALLEAQAQADPSRKANLLVELGRVALAAGRPAEASGRLERALALRREALGESNWKTAEARAEWGRALLALGRRAEAARELDGSLAVLATAQPLRARRALAVAERARAQLGQAG